MHFTIPGRAYALLFLVVAGCGSDYNAPTPPVNPPPVIPPVDSSGYGLWTASGASSVVLRLAMEQLSGTGDRTPATAFTTPDALLASLAGLAFDPQGNMWITSSDDDRLVSFPAGAIASSGPRAATTVIESNGGSLSLPTGLAFDQQHRLWVANFANGTVVRFDSAQLASSGNPQPSVVLTTLGFPVSIAFDASGSLWVSDNRENTISKYTAAQLVTSGSPEPAVVLDRSQTGLRSPLGIAFDATGNLWVANTAHANLLAFSPAQQAVSGRPEPHIVIAAAVGNFGVPVGLAFDGDGSLWVVGGGGALTKLAAASIAASGAPVPSAELSVGGHSLLWSAAFWPVPAGLPLN